MKNLKTIGVWLAIFCGLLFLVGCSKEEESPIKEEVRKEEDSGIRLVQEYVSFKQIAKLPLRDLQKREAWQKVVPEVVEIAIPRSNEEVEQPALWYHSGSKKKKPLLLVLHSWSADYRQHYGIPYGAFAKENDWIFIHPNYRGEFDNEEATGSEKAVRDVLEALAYAESHAPVDTDRIYLAGFSGGAMMALIMAGRFPEKFTAVLSWVPVFDLNDWYGSVTQSLQAYADNYRKDIEASCGGKPDTDDKAKASCRDRSPATYLSNARGKPVKVFISGGIHDHFVPPSHAIRAFNELAEADDRISAADYRFLDENEALPDGLKGHGEKNRLFEEADLPVIFKRRSANATLVLFDGGHDIVYNAGFLWLSEQQR